MPGERCAVAACNNSRIKTRELPNDVTKIIYHRFPKDTELSKQWAHRCKRADKSFNPVTSSICSNHFTDNDYERDLKSELLNLPPKKMLKLNAVPSVNLDKISISSTMLGAKSEREDRLKNREVKQVVKELICVGNIVESFPKENEKDILNIENQKLKERVSLLESKINLDTKHIKKLKKENQNLKRTANKIKRIHANAHKVLTSVFTKNQIALLLNKKKQVAWTSDEMSLAFTLRYFSKRCFLFIKRKMKIPLPGLSTLQRWASRFEIRQGLMLSVLKYLEVAKSKLSETERLVVLQFDEIKVKRILEYDHKQDQVVGPYTYMQVISARGLFSKWKQPIYVKFDTQITKVILCSVIDKLKSTGYTVKACVSDLGGGNVGLWKQLDVTIEKTFFESTSGDKIYMFADAPHVLKLIRNWFLDTGFRLANGSIVDKTPVAKIIEIEKSQELKTCHKLTELHLTVQKTQRQNVRKASELLSHTTATALMYYLKENELAETTGGFIELVNKWFDLMNSYCPRQFGEPSKRPYGQDLENQDKILLEMEDTMKTMRCNGKNVMQLFQKGCIMSTISLRELLKDTKEYGVKYLLTHRLNQDCLENLFSQIRTRGGLNDHPTPLEAVYRLRMIILGKTQGVLQSGTNTNNPDDNAETIVSKVLKAVGVEVEEREEENIGMETFSSDPEYISFGSSSTSKINNDSTNDALSYLAGWVAKKFKTNYPSLEDKSGKVDTKEMTASWLSHLSYGGLTKPSSEWLQQARKLEEEFLLFNGSQIYKGKGVVKTLTHSALKKHPEIPHDVVKTFMRQRIFIRMKFLNSEIIRKRKICTTPDSTIKKKYKKLLS